MYYGDVTASQMDPAFINDFRLSIEQAHQAFHDRIFISYKVDNLYCYARAHLSLLKIDLFRKYCRSIRLEEIREECPSLLSPSEREIDDPDLACLSIKVGEGPALPLYLAYREFNFPLSELRSQLAHLSLMMGDRELHSYFCSRLTAISQMYIGSGSPPHREDQNGESDLDRSLTASLARMVNEEETQAAVEIIHHFNQLGLALDREAAIALSADPRMSFTIGDVLKLQEGCLNSLPHSPRLKSLYRGALDRCRLHASTSLPSLLTDKLLQRERESLNDLDSATLDDDFIFDVEDPLWSLLDYDDNVPFFDALNYASGGWLKEADLEGCSIHGELLWGIVDFFAQSACRSLKEWLDLFYPAYMTVNRCDLSHVADSRTIAVAINCRANLECSIDNQAGRLHVSLYREQSDYPSNNAGFKYRGWERDATFSPDLPTRTSLIKSIPREGHVFNIVPCIPLEISVEADTLVGFDQICQKHLETIKKRWPRVKLELRPSWSHVRIISPSDHQDSSCYLSGFRDVFFTFQDANGILLSPIPMERLWLSADKRVKATTSCLMSLLQQSLISACPLDIPYRCLPYTIATRGYRAEGLSLIREDEDDIYFRGQSLRHPLEHCRGPVNLLYLMEKVGYLINVSTLSPSALESLQLVDSFKRDGKNQRDRATDIIFEMV